MAVRRHIQLNEVKGMVIEICVGSSCHIKGAYQVIEKLRAFVDENALENEITLKACFCMGNCGEGVSIRIDNEKIMWLTPETCDAFTAQLLAEKRG